MSVDAPGYFIVLLLLPAMTGLFLWRRRIIKFRLRKYADKHLLDSLLINHQASQALLRYILWSISLFCLIIALTRPTWGIAEELVEAHGLSVIVVLDVSSSMDAQDMLPSRLERAKRTAREIIAGSDGNQVGLVLFAGSAVVQLPLTTDTNIAELFIQAASTHAISRQGTALADAIESALDIIDKRIVSNSVIIVLSDGENHEGDPVLIAQKAAERGVVIHAIGYGDPVEGEPIPVTNPDGTFADSYKTDIAGRLILSRLDETALRTVAEITKGTYQRAGDTGIETVNLLNTIRKIEGETLEKRLEIRKIHRFEIFVGLALLLMILESLADYVRPSK